MAVTLKSPVRRRNPAELVLEREYEGLRSSVLSALRAKFAARRVRFDDADLEGFYNQAWHALYDRLLAGEEIDNRAGFLVHVASLRGIEELRRLHPERRAEGVDVDRASEDVDLAARLDDHAELRQLMQGMRGRLTTRERAAAALCYVHGLSRPEAAQALGVAPKRMEKLMDGVSRKVGGLVEEIRGGSFCESQSSLVKAYAFGLLDTEGERYTLAQAHLEECTSCRRQVRSLRGIAAVVPPVALPLLALKALGLGGAGVAAGAAATAAGGSGGSGGAGAAGSAAAGSGGASGGAIAAAATALVAAAAFGVYAVSSHKSDAPPKKPVVLRAAPRTTSSPAAAAPAASAAKPKSKPARKAAKHRAKAKPAPAAVPGPPVSQATPASSPQAAAPAPAPAPKSTPSPAPAPRPTTDADQEFGFEQ